MNRRERLLLGFVLALTGAWFLVYAWTALLSDDPRLDRIADLELEIERYERQIRLGAAARRQIGELEARALPADAQLARDRYQEWLFARVEQAGLRQWSIDPLAARTTERAGTPIGFSVRGVGNLGEFAVLLKAFYQQDYLHQIRQLQLRPLEGSKDLDISLLVQALSLPGVTTRDTLPTDVPPRIETAEADRAVQAILERNLFAPENNAPRLASIGDIKVALGESASIEPQAEDPDPLDRLSWSLVGEKPAGASFDTASGKFRWTPPELGTYAIELRVTDDGFPAKSDSQRIAIQVVEPPPPPKVAAQEAKPKPSFDRAKHAYLISTIQKNDEWQMWLHDRTRDEIRKLRIGDRIEIGTVEATVVRISPSEVELDADGKRLLISIGESLTEGLELPAGGI